MKPPKHKIFCDTGSLSVINRHTCSVCAHKQKHTLDN